MNFYVIADFINKASRKSLKYLLDTEEVQKVVSKRYCYITINLIFHNFI